MTDDALHVGAARFTGPQDVPIDAHEAILNSMFAIMLAEQECDERSEARRARASVREDPRAGNPKSRLLSIPCPRRQLTQEFGQAVICARKPLVVRTQDHPQCRIGSHYVGHGFSVSAREGIPESASDRF